LADCYNLKMIKQVQSSDKVKPYVDYSQNPAHGLK
jgi:hypothetical protein